MNDALPIADIVHAIPGRTRLRIATRRGDDVFFAAIATGLLTIPGVSHVEIRPLTGSVLIQHAIPLARIGIAAEQERLFVFVGATTIRRPSPRSLLPISINPKLVAAGGLGVFALWQLTQGHVLPPAITLAWYASNLAGFLSNGESVEDAG